MMWSIKMMQWKRMFKVSYIEICWVLFVSFKLVIFEIFQFQNKYYGPKECEKMSKEYVRTRVIKYFLTEIIALRSFSDVLTSEFIAVFNIKYFQVQVGSKIFLQQLHSGVSILLNYQILFDQLLCFQEISMTESQSQNSALNSAVKPLQIA